MTAAYAYLNTMRMPVRRYLVLRVLNEAEADLRLVSRAQQLAGHGHDGSGLTHAAHMHCKHKHAITSK